MSVTTIHFKAVPAGLSVEADFDTGWHKELKCSGVGGWQVIIPYANGTASIEFKSVRHTNHETYSRRTCMITATESSGTVNVEADFDGVVFTKVSESSFTIHGPATQVHSTYIPVRDTVDL